jgi:hypothetical protein
MKRLLKKLDLTTPATIYVDVVRALWHTMAAPPSNRQSVDRENPNGRRFRPTQDDKASRSPTALQPAAQSQEGGF